MTLLDLIEKRKRWSQLDEHAKAHDLDPAAVHRLVSAGIAATNDRISAAIERPAPFVPTLVDIGGKLYVWVEDGDGKRFVEAHPIKAEDVKVV